MTERDDPPPPGVAGRPAKGRGALSNRSGRYERHERVPDADTDSWSDRGPDARDDVTVPSGPKTELFVDSSRTILARNDSPDVPFARSVNPYRGCEHGCIYCFARPSHAWLGLSPGLDFETKLFYKPRAPELLDQALRAPRYQPEPLALGANTDPYQPAERRLELTRRCLEVLQRFRHPVGLITKSHLITRDLDVLADMASQRLVMACVSITTLDRAVARMLEPRAPTPARRLEAIRALSDAGVPTAVLVSPIISGLTDHEMERILEAAAEAGAVAANYIVVRLPLEIGPLFQEWLAAHVPDRAQRVLSLIRQYREGALYQSTFGTRMTGTGPMADLLSQRFKRACRRLGFAGRRWEDLDYGRFRVPSVRTGQLSLFED